MITVEEGGHLTVALLALVNNGLNDVGSHFGRNHTDEYQLVAVIIPERRIRVIVKTVVYYLTTHIGIFVIHVAAQSRPLKGMEESRIKQSFFTFRTA